MGAHLTTRASGGARLANALPKSAFLASYEKKRRGPVFKGDLIRSSSDVTCMYVNAPEVTRNKIRPHPRYSSSTGLSGSKKPTAKPATAARAAVHSATEKLPKKASNRTDAWDDARGGLRALDPDLESRD